MREEYAFSDDANGYQRNQVEYSYRLPTPPRIVVPPPTLSSDSPSLNVELASINDPQLAFLKEMDLEDIVSKNTVLEWAYERRRQAQMILPWLYLGPMVSAKDKVFLAREGITMVLAVRAREGTMNGALTAARDVCPDVVTLEASTMNELIARFADSIRTINAHMIRIRQRALEKLGHPILGKVLIFCESGNERSAAVAAAYLMTMLDKLDYVKAMQVCQAQRFCVNFDDSIKNMLRAYWDLLQAQRSIETSEGHSSANPSQNGTNQIVSAKQKRRIEDTYDDEDTEMGDALDPSDALRFTGRDVTPFLNRHA